MALRRKRSGSASRFGAEDPRPLRVQVAEALAASDSVTAWYFDRTKPRVVWVRGGETCDDELTPGEVDADENRFAEIPAVTESEIHDWMEDFAAAHEEGAHVSLLDDKAGANARFLARLEKKSPAAFAAWNSFRDARFLTAADAWIASAAQSG